MCAMAGWTEDGNCPKLLELLPVLEPHAAAMDRESRHSNAPAQAPSSKLQFKPRVASGLVWTLRNSKPTCTSRTSPILAWLPNAPRTLHPLISQPLSTTLSRD